MGLCYSNDRDAENLKRAKRRRSDRFFRNTYYKYNNQGSQLEINNDVLVSGIESSPELLYEKKQRLGIGAFGEVWLVHQNELNRDFAMKIINKRRCREEEDEIKNEIEILKKLDHPKILKILEFFNTRNKYYILTEYCPEGELFNEITKVGQFSEVQAAFIIYQLLQIVKYCHKMRIIHRDIKPENVMITKREKNGCLQVKLIDFGTAKIFSENNKEKGFVGSSYYMAPEVIKRKYDEKCDLWSIGVIMYILLTGRPPFDGEDDDEIVKNVEKGEYDIESPPFPSLSNNAKDLIQQLLMYDPQKRINVDDALLHDWFKTDEFIEVSKVNCINKELANKLLENMMNYKSDNMLKCAVLAYLVHHNSNIEECVEASKLYNDIDVENNGKIEKLDLENGLRDYWNLPADEATKKAEVIFQNIDNDHNGYIEHEEFIRAAINPNIFLKENYLKFAFNYFDMDRSGGISIDEISKKFTQNSRNKESKIEKDLKKIFSKIDVNNDGTLSFDEFGMMMRDIMES